MRRRSRARGRCAAEFFVRGRRAFQSDEFAVRASSPRAHVRRVRRALRSSVRVATVVMSDDEVCGGADGIDATARDDFGVEGVAALDAEATSALAALEARLAQKDFMWNRTRSMT